MSMSERSRTDDVLCLAPIGLCLAIKFIVNGRAYRYVDTRYVVRGSVSRGLPLGDGGLLAFADCFHGLLGLFPACGCEVRIL
jgi:hypothetical protein